MAKRKPSPKFSGKAKHVNIKGLAMNAEIPVQEAGEHIKKIIDRDGSAQPRAVWKGLDKSDPIYPCFEWSAARGSEKYRDLQAAMMIRTIKVSIRLAPKTTCTQRAFVSIRPDTETQERAYVSIENAMQNTDDKNFVLNQVLTQLCNFRKRWRELNDLAEYKGPLELVDQAILELQSIVAGE